MSDLFSFKRLRRIWGPYVLSSGGVLLALMGCNAHEDEVVVGGVNIKDEAQVSAFLVGTWSRHYLEGELSIDKTLRLDSNGEFIETVSITTPKSSHEMHEHSGTWLYDGTNIKRNYVLMDSKPPSRLNLPFVTFEVKIESKNEFIGIDHIHHHEIHYQRLP
jgi:hypothetical protein